jgi:tetratricopeptide (TPR) repeat protein
MTIRPPRSIVALLAAAIAWSATPARGNPASAALRARAADELYNLDRDEALATYRQAVAADPTDAAAYRGVATALWLSITFNRGNMTVDDYLGRVARPASKPPPPPPETAAAFNAALDRAAALAGDALAATPRDAEARYQLGAALGLRASWVATVDGSMLGAFRVARRAYDEEEEVLDLDPARKDAGLIVGTYRYLVASLSLPLRWAAYVVGFGGGKEKGLQLVEQAAGYPGDNQTDARFALVLLYNREHRYDEALAQLARLRTLYPRNRLVWLETGSTELRAGRGADAVRDLEAGMARFASDGRPRMFGENALWHYKRGAARAAVGRTADAEQDLRAAVSLEGRDWVHGRAHLELGSLALKAGDRTAARRELEAAIRLSEGDNDLSTADEARRLLKGE